MAGSLLLTTDSTGSSQNITATLQLATYTASAATVVTPSVRLSALNGAAATITLTWRHYASDGTTLIREQAYSFVKPQTASTVAGDDMPSVLIANGEKLTIAAKSTNASDTAAAYTISWLNGAAADVQQVLSTAATAATAGILDVNTKNINNVAAGTLPTNFSALSIDSGGVVKSNLAQILGTALTETAGLLAAGFKKFFNIATPTGTVNSLPDVVPGLSGGLSINGANTGTVSFSGPTTYTGRVVYSSGVTFNDASLTTIDVSGTITAAALTVTNNTTLGPVTIINGSGIGLEIQGSSHAFKLTGLAGKGMLISGTTSDIGLAGTGTMTGTIATVTTVTNLTNAPTAGDFTAAMKTSLNAATPNSTSIAAIKTNTDLLATGWTVVSNAIVFTAPALANAGGGGGTPLNVKSSIIWTKGTTP